MKMAWCLRLALAGDLAHLESIEADGVELLNAAGADLPADGALTPPEILETCLQDGLLVVATDPEDHPVGFLAAAERDGFLYLGELDVAASWRRLGIGRALVCWGIEEARRRSLRGAMLTTDRFVPFNAPFYARVGFAPVEESAAPPSLREVLKMEREGGLKAERRIAMLYQC
jgi:GNAT superfamily N-acetyltransferase